MSKIDAEPLNSRGSLLLGVLRKRRQKVMLHTHMQLETIVVGSFEVCQKLKCILKKWYVLGSFEEEVSKSDIEHLHTTRDHSC